MNNAPVSILEHLVNYLGLWIKDLSQLQVPLSNEANPLTQNATPLSKYQLVS